VTRPECKRAQSIAAGASQNERKARLLGDGDERAGSSLIEPKRAPVCCGALVLSFFEQARGCHSPDPLDSGRRNPKRAGGREGRTRERDGKDVLRILPFTSLSFFSRVLMHPSIHPSILSDPPRHSAARPVSLVSQWQRGHEGRRRSFGCTHCDTRMPTPSLCALPFSCEPRACLTRRAFFALCSGFSTKTNESSNRKSAAIEWEQRTRKRKSLTCSRARRLHLDERGGDGSGGRTFAR
jgi:hypothetical protein